LTKELGFLKKKIIKDIRLFKDNSQFGVKKLNAIVNRVVMKLRENEFSFGEFDHLYINFTTCDMAVKMHLSDEADRYHPWYRCCAVPVEMDFYNKLGSPETYDGIIHWISTVLITYFSTEDFDEARILSCVQQAVVQGEEMLMKFKEKCSTKRRAVIFLRYLDTCKFYPLLRVYDMEDHLLLEKDLPETLLLDYLGEIQVGVKHVTIKPRKNTYTAQNQPMTIDY
jgi:hypothetical protein